MPPLVAAQRPKISVVCGRVRDTRVRYGERVVIIAVAAFMITTGVLDSVANGATASALGVKTRPVMILAPSRVISSWAKRLATSGLGPASSRRMISILWPPELSPFLATNSFTALSWVRPRLAKGPDVVVMKPTLTVSAVAGPAMRAMAAEAARRRVRRMRVSLDRFVIGGHFAPRAGEPQSRPVGDTPLGEPGISC